MSTADYTQGASAPSGYGTAYVQPTGTGLPGYEPGRFSTDRPRPAAADEVLCDEACVPKRDCVHCRAETRS